MPGSSCLGTYCDIPTPEKAGLHSSSVSSLYYCAYRTTPTAALQVVTGLQPLHLQIQQEATYAELLEQDLHPTFSPLY
ncbi:hypothetical protein AVEN_168864-1 [Araneus ventricosus]|uniref:Uncharacterized protein n=1 Tax=Araneus ventricosus TaxID=182803 RepID=A0A4Y2KZB9_ARAVE|nr:hypothetical protein AVEN_168864-1 [Araneus ventricosus]